MGQQDHNHVHTQSMKQSSPPSHYLSDTLKT